MNILIYFDILVKRTPRIPSLSNNSKKSACLAPSICPAHPTVSAKLYLSLLKINNISISATLPHKIQWCSTLLTRVESPIKNDSQLRIMVETVNFWILQGGPWTQTNSPILLERTSMTLVYKISRGLAASGMDLMVLEGGIRKICILDWIRRFLTLARKWKIRICILINLMWLGSKKTTKL